MRGSTQHEFVLRNILTVNLKSLNTNEYLHFYTNEQWKVKLFAS